MNRLIWYAWYINLLLNTFTSKNSILPPTTKGKIHSPIQYTTQVWHFLERPGLYRSSENISNPITSLCGLFRPQSSHRINTSIKIVHFCCWGLNYWQYNSAIQWNHSLASWDAFYGVKNINKSKYKVHLPAYIYALSLASIIYNYTGQFMHGYSTINAIFLHISSWE